MRECELKYWFSLQEGGHFEQVDERFYRKGIGPWHGGLGNLAWKELAARQTDERKSLAGVQKSERDGWRKAGPCGRSGARARAAVRDGGTFFTMEESGGAAAFADWGTRIYFFSSSETALRTGLELARRKWCGIKVWGNPEFMRTGPEP
ncbi:MAG: hypothetical protein LBT40_12105 [Deltaproteobacteria bacterium]|jgi:hypothetical protein|nr:hypothetical protein [Deltaproteobacteria bacterium]